MYYLFFVERHKSRANSRADRLREEPKSINDEEVTGGGTMEEQAEVTTSDIIVIS